MRSLPIIALNLLLIFVGGCSTTKRVLLKSDPSGAEVYSVSGGKIGSTPLEITGTELEKATVSGRLSVLVKRMGFLSRELVIDEYGRDEYLIKLSPLDSDFFRREFTKQYSREVNGIVREILTIQGLSIAGKLAEAETKLLLLEQKYPNVAAVYTLLADIALSKRDLDKARAYLIKGEVLDSEDPVIQQRLKSLERGQTRK